MFCSHLSHGHLFFLNPCSRHSSRQRILRSFPTCNPPFSKCILSFLCYLLLSIKRIAWICTYIIFVSCPVCFFRPVCIRLWLSLSSYFIETTQRIAVFLFFQCNIYLFPRFMLLPAVFHCGLESK